MYPFLVNGPFYDQASQRIGALVLLLINVNGCQYIDIGGHNSSPGHSPNTAHKVKVKALSSDVPTCVSSMLIKGTAMYLLCLERPLSVPGG